MKRIATLAFVSALASATGATAQDDDKRNAKGEAELAKILEDRVAGEPQRCLAETKRRNLEIVDGTAIVWRDGDTIWVNRTRSPQFLDDFDLPVFKIFGNDLCRLDQVEMRDRTGGVPGPVIGLADFVPYRTVDSDTGA
ncbi:hypothetical protein [Qipengyuania sp. JC766]|uniref:hypothetical protein n=1 Tax=Qipengyuania sp. JC766 TaxID=3232139 RepID=UPI003457B772